MPSRASRPRHSGWGTSFFIKEPRNTGFVSWHQDATYWGLEPPDVVTVWIAFTEANRDNGCMAFIPGTHTPRSPHATPSPRQSAHRGQEIASRWTRPSGHVELEPGEMSLHHVKLFHGSEPNPSDDRRIGWRSATFRPT